MRYLPLTDADRSAMLAVIGAPSIDELFVDVPEAAHCLDGPIAGLPMHASEMAVERHMAALVEARTSRPAMRRSSSARGLSPPCPGERRSPDPARRVPDRLHALPARNRAGHAADAVRVPDARSRGCSARESPTPRCTTARPPAGKRSRWRGASPSAARRSSRPGCTRIMSRVAQDDGEVHRRRASNTPLPALIAETDIAALIDGDRRRDRAASSCSIPTSSAASPI